MALVRARRLVFTQRCFLAKQSVFISDCGCYSIWRENKSWQSSKRPSTWLSSENSESMTEDEAFAENVANCQSDFDSRWLADTEVLPLEWATVGSSPDIYAKTLGGEYYVDKRSGGFCWYLSRSDYGTDAVMCNSQELAIDAANEHNRKTILGE